ncbi:MAG TPA: hypothetical protein VM076_22675 [Gemmatimonadaceae bacterium]|nr:hypothetical protein [Gemmatimonadaceae bacterium]
MFIELVDSLRCVNAHEDTWLVAAVTRMDGRHVAEGSLGCPVCRRTYEVREGVAWFTGSPAREAGLTLPAPASDERTMRLAALLGLAEPGGIVALGGSWSDCSTGIAERGVAHVVVVNAAAPSDAPQEVSSIVVEDRLPFAPGSVRAIALDARLATVLPSAAHALRSRGRLVGPATATMPNDVTELARDEQDWVAERAVVASQPVALQLRPRR